MARNSWANWFLVENGVVYASAAKGEDTTGGGDIYALQSSNGSVLWHVVNVKGIVSHALMEN
jgi:hypothetical protein